jgi:hypothetical protein
MNDPHAWSRRSFLGIAGGLAFAASLRAGDGNDDKTPDGSAAKDMITLEAQQAIDRGLDYLSRSQHTDGSWGDRQYTGNVAVTSLAALAFMAGGHQPGRGPYGKQVKSAIEYVLGRESKQPGSPPGFLFNPANTQFGAMYSHGFGALLLGEAYGMIPNKTEQRRLREALERAVKLIIDTQNDAGGWRYEPKKSAADVSVTICQIMSLRSARNAGLTVPKETVDRCVKYVRACQNPDGGFAYMPHQGPSAFPRTAAGVCALYSAGVYEGDDIRKGLDYLMKFRPGRMQYGRSGGLDMHYFYGQYYAAQVMWTAGGDYWKEWFPAIREELINRSRLRADGSTVCADYDTAMACIILQIPNNYLPIMQK